MNVIPGSKKVFEGLFAKKINKIVLFGDQLVAEQIRQKDAAKSFCYCKLEIKFLNLHYNFLIIYFSKSQANNSDYPGIMRFKQHC